MDIPQRSADISLPDHWRHTLSPPEDALPSSSQGKAWWTQFNNDDLDRLVAQVLDSNLQVREMAARVAEAEALEVEAARAFRPSVQLAAAPVGTPDSRAAYLQSGIEAGWPLGLFGRAAATKSAAEADAQLTKSDADSLRARIVADTVRSYAEWRAALSALSNLDARIAAQAERAELMRARVRLRLSNLADSGAEDARLEELRSQRLALDRKVTTESERLGLLTATAEAYEPTVTPSEVRVITPPRKLGVPADLLRSRADVRRAEQAALKAVAQLDIAKADLYPQITLIGSLNVSIPIAGGAGGTARSLAAVAPAIDIPLFDWGRRRAIVTAQDRSLEAALIAYRECILTAVHEVEGALASLDSMDREAEIQRTALQRAQARESASMKAIGLGRVSRFDLLAVTLARLEARASLDGAEHARTVAFIALCEALGGSNPAYST